jgi:hypothetical protein
MSKDKELEFYTEKAFPELIKVCVRLQTPISTESRSR